MGLPWRQRPNPSRCLRIVQDWPDQPSEMIQGLSNNSKGGLRGLIMGKVVTICSLAPPGPDEVGAGPQQEGVRTDRWQSGGLEAGELS